METLGDRNAYRKLDPWTKCRAYGESDPERKEQICPLDDGTVEKPINREPYMIDLVSRWALGFFFLPDQGSRSL